jgi:hypothetical protein
MYFEFAARARLPLAYGATPSSKKLQISTEIAADTANLQKPYFQ